MRILELLWQLDRILLDCDVLDPIVVARDGWVSLRDRGVSLDRVIRSNWGK